VYCFEVQIVKMAEGSAASSSDSVGSADVKRLRTAAVANSSSTWLRLIALLELRLVKPSTFTETHEHEPRSVDAPLQKPNTFLAYNAKNS
jgi:hypothetical protein